MRLPCFYCGKSVSSELPDDAVVRATCECPECVAKRQQFSPTPTQLAILLRLVSRELERCSACPCAECAELGRLREALQKELEAIPRSP